MFVKRGDEYESSQNYELILSEKSKLEVPALTDSAKVVIGSIKSLDEDGRAEIKILKVLT